jgi:hypothetical protein
MFSCADCLYDYLATNDDDPVVVKPQVRSFDVANSIVISWDKDIGADEYILYRDTKPTGLFSTEVYRGTDLKYIDSNVVSETFYYYKLAKKRGQKEFDKSDYVMGVGFNITKDAYEENNTKTTAVSLDSITKCNIYYFKDTYGNFLQDFDWFYVDLKARTYMTIQFTTFDNLKEGDIECNQESYQTKSLSTGKEVEIRNDEYYDQRLYFQVAVVPTVFIQNSTFSGGKMGDYTINIVQINSIIPVQ